MRALRAVGIAGYGAYVPRFRLETRLIAEVWRPRGGGELPIPEKAVPGLDEDTITMAIEAARTAIRRSGLPASQIGGVWLGSESSPYAAKPGATVVAAALGMKEQVLASDLQFACKAGSEAMQAAIAAVGSGMMTVALAIGMDVAEARPGDVLEHMAGAGGAAFVLAPADRSIATIDGSSSFVTDTPDFFRREGAAYPQHTGRFTEQPGYFRHSTEAATQLLDELKASPEDFAHVVFHQPHPKLVERLARALGFTKAQVSRGLCASAAGNAYAGSAMLGLAAVFDVAEPGERVLLCSYGSGAGSDAIAFTVNESIRSRRDGAGVARHLARRYLLNYAEYLRLTERIRM